MQSTDAVTALAALAQPTRLAAFRMLVKAGPQGLFVGRIAEALDVAMPTLSFHLKELARAGLIDARQESRFIYYAANFERMNALLGFLTENCCEASGTGWAAPACRPTDKISVRRSKPDETVSRPRRSR